LKQALQILTIGIFQIYGYLLHVKHFLTAGLYGQLGDNYIAGSYNYFFSHK